MAQLCIVHYKNKPKYSNLVQRSDNSISRIRQAKVLHMESGKNELHKE